MFKVGVFVGKMLPPTRGHLHSIILASTMCEKLYVVVSDNMFLSSRLCNEVHCQYMPANLRVQWLSQELQGLEHVKVILLDETDIPEYPNGWEAWAKRLEEVVSEPINAIFGGELDYQEGYATYFPSTQYVLIDYGRSRYPISATMVRENPLRYWDYIVGSARPFFAKRVLVVGTESTGKTTLVKNLAKIYHTSWSEEVGRDYAKKYLGGNETIFTDDDFFRIAYLQRENDLQAARSANKVVFIDTDAVTTEYYSELYMGHGNAGVQRFINPNQFDLVILLTPKVKWVDDGQRLNGEQRRREQLHELLRRKYIVHGFRNVIEIDSDDYSVRLNKAIEVVDKLLQGGH